MRREIKNWHPELSLVHVYSIQKFVRSARAFATLTKISRNISASSWLNLEARRYVIDILRVRCSEERKVNWVISLLLAAEKHIFLCARARARVCALGLSIWDTYLPVRICPRTRYNSTYREKLIVAYYALSTPRINCEGCGVHARARDSFVTRIHSRGGFRSAIPVWARNKHDRKSASTVRRLVHIPLSE